MGVVELGPELDVADQQPVHGGRSAAAQLLVEGFASYRVGMPEHTELRTGMSLEQTSERARVEVERKQEGRSELELGVVDSDVGNGDQPRSQSVRLGATLQRRGDREEATDWPLVIDGYHAPARCAEMQRRFLAHG